MVAAYSETRTRMFRSRRRWTRRDELRLCFPKIFPCFASLVQITFRLRFNGNDRASLRARSTMARVMGMENTRFTGEQYSYPILSATTRYNGKTTEMCFSIPSKYIILPLFFFPLQLAKPFDPISFRLLQKEERSG